MPHFHDVTIDADGSVVLGAGADLTLGDGSILTVPDNAEVNFQGSSSPASARLNLGAYSTLDVSEATATILLRNGGSVSRIDGGVFNTNLLDTGDFYKLIHEDTIAGGNGVKRRWYIYNFAGSDAHGRLLYTVNARWNQGDLRWYKDSGVAGVNYSYRFDFPEGWSASEVGIARENGSASFNEAGWTAERVGIGYDSNGSPRLRLRGTDISTSAPEANSLYAANMIKAYISGHYVQVSDTFTLNKSFNMSYNGVNSGPNWIKFDIATDIDTPYLVLFGCRSAGQKVEVETAAPGSLQLLVYDADNVAGGPIDIKNVVGTYTIDLAIVGMQT